MPLFLKTVRSVWTFGQKLALECTKLMKVGLFLDLDTTDVNEKDVSQLHFGIIEGLATSLCQSSKIVYSSWICIIGTCS